MRFSGLSAFPLTPLRDDRVDLRSYAALIERVAAHDVDSLVSLGGTGSYAYLNSDERRQVARTAIKHAGNRPVVVGVGGFRTSHVLDLARHSADIGAAGVLVGPVAYQALADHEVLGLFQDLVSAVQLPVIVYDGAGGTPFAFSDDLYERVAALPSISAIKTPGLPSGPTAAEHRVTAIRALIPRDVAIGVSGDEAAAEGLNAGADVWFSVIGGLFPEVGLAISKASQAGQNDDALDASGRMQPLWELFRAYGSYRVIAAAAEDLGVAARDSLPRPVRGLLPEARLKVHSVLAALELS